MAYNPYLQPHPYPMCKSASGREKITILTNGTQSVWLCLGRTGPWAHCLLSLTLACQRNSKHPSYVSIRLLIKFCHYALLRRADNMRCSMYWQAESPDCKELPKGLEIDSLSIWIISISFICCFHKQLYNSYINNY